MTVQTQKKTPISIIDNDEAPALPFKLKIINRINILKCFRDGKGHTVSEISGLTGISKITTMRAVHFFCEKGVLITQGKVYQNNTGGKYPEIFKLYITKYILCITMWPGIVCLTLMDFCGNVIKRVEYLDIDTHKTSVDEIEEFLLQKIVLLLDEMNIDKEEVYGVAVSTAGIIDYQNKRIKYNAQASEWGNNISILDPLKQFFGENTYFFLENGGKTIARAILRRPEVGKKRVLIFTTTWGISGCFMQEGRILNGKNSLIGEIGHMILDANDKEKCSCGSHGCLERMVDIKRIRESLKERTLPEESGLNAIPWNEVTLLDLFNLANQGDMVSQEYVAYLADCFALTLRNISLVFDPELVFFIGDYAYAGEYFDRCLKTKLSEFRYYANDDFFEIMYEEETMLKMDYIGAAVAVTDHFFDDVELYEGE
ncbi:MAG: ROK family protein [Eubacteriales bacterium]|nr:ROK family protein [Eubacteriales bacterium]